MIRRIVTTLGTAALSVGLILGTSPAAYAQHHGGGHAGGGHMGGGHAAAPGFHGGGAAFRGGAPAYHGGGYAYRPYGGYYGGYRPYGGYYGGYRNYGYYPGFGLSIALGGLGLYRGLGYGGYYGGYPGSYAYGYPSSSYGYAGDSYYSYPPASGYLEPYAAPAPPANYQSLYQPPAATTSSTATITVRLPADATLWVDDYQSQQTGAVRQLVTPGALEPGKMYHYTLKAQWTENGQPVVRERVVNFQAGNSVIVDMAQPGA